MIMQESFYNACYVGDNEDLKRALAEIWEPDAAAWTFFPDGRAAAGALLTSPPDILVCSMVLPDMSGLAVARLLKEENVYSQVPVVMCLSPEESEGDVDWSNLDADDFFIFPSPMVAIKARLELAMGRASRTLDATRLPGYRAIRPSSSTRRALSTNTRISPWATATWIISSRSTISMASRAGTRC